MDSARLAIDSGATTRSLNTGLKTGDEFIMAAVAGVGEVGLQGPRGRTSRDGQEGG